MYASGGRSSPLRREFDARITYDGMGNARGFDGSLLIFPEEPGTAVWLDDSMANNLDESFLRQISIDDPFASATWGLTSRNPSRCVTAAFLKTPGSSGRTESALELELQNYLA